MSERSLAQQANALITKYVSLYKLKHGEPPVVNRYRERWGFQSMIEDLGNTDAHKVVEYYIGLRKTNHDVQELLRSYDELHRNRLADEKDLKDREQLRIETARRVKEYLERNGK